MNDVMEAKGYCSRVKFDGHALTITFNGLQKSTLGMDSAVIPLENIVGVSLKEPSWLTNGVMCVQVMLPDGQISPIVDSPSVAVGSPYCAIVIKTRQREFEKLISAIEAARPNDPIPADRDLSIMTKAARKESEVKPSSSENSVAGRGMTSSAGDMPMFMMRGSKIGKFKGDDGTDFILYQHTIKCGGEEHRLDGVTAVVEDGSALESRFTATRIFLLGAFALAFKKRKGGEKWLGIMGPDFAWVARADRKHIGDAMKFAAQVNDQARKEANR